jgi:hypothetical protein
MADTRQGRSSGDASVRDLIAQLGADLSNLVRQEMRLAKTEIADKVQGVGSGARMFGVAGGIGFWAVGALTATLILALGLVMPHALAALVVTVVYGVVALVLFLNGRRKLKQAAVPVPTETIEQVKEDVQWLKDRTTSGES